MRIAQPGVDLIKHFESCELEAYPDPMSPLGKACTAHGLALRNYRQIAGHEALSGDPWTIGYGHTGPGIHAGVIWTLSEAERGLEDDLVQRENIVDQAVAVVIQQRHFDALVSIVFNVGAGAKGHRDGIITLASGNPSTLLRSLNAGDFTNAADEFLKWTHAGGVEVKGLHRRRAAERALFRGEDWLAAANAAT